MDAFQSYVYGTAGWLSIQALTLILVPKLAISLLAQEAHYATDLEIYFSRSLGYSLITIVIIVLFFTSTIPLSSAITQPATSSDGADLKSPYAAPIVQVTTLFHFIGLVYCYVRYTNEGLTGFLLGALGYGAMTMLGGWCVLFGMEAGKVSRRTGRDKRMSGFPFKNVNEYDKRTDKKMG